MSFREPAPTDHSDRPRVNIPPTSAPPYTDRPKPDVLPGHWVSKLALVKAQNSNQTGDRSVGLNAPFDPSIPPLQWKRDNLGIDEREGVVYIGGSPSQHQRSRLYYTRLDQALMLWAIATAIIFFTAQFHAFDWHHQARVWSALSLASLGVTSIRAWPWAEALGLRWVTYLWTGIVLLGLGLTDYGVYRSVGPILLNLCPLWLGLCALGYGITAVGMGSRALMGIVAMHGLAIVGVKLWPTGLFGITGAAIAGSLLILGQLEWDHRASVPRSTAR